MFKKSKNLPLLLATAAFLPLQLLAAPSDNSAPSEGFYIGANAGVGYLPSEDVKFSTWSTTIATGSNAGTYTLDTLSIKNKGTYDFAGGVAVGYMMSNYLQFEAEGGMAMSPKLKVKSTTILPDTSGVSINDNEMGKTSVFYGMASGYFNIDMGNSFMPYVGVGAGFGHYKIALSDNTFNTSFTIDGKTTGNTTPKATLKDIIAGQDVTKNSLILQGSAGVNMMITDTIMVGAGYRFLGSAGELELETDSGSGSATTTTANKVKYQYMRHLGVVSAKFLM